MGELIYPLRGVDLMKFIQNEPIPIRNMKEKHKNSKKCSFDWILEPIGQICKNRVIQSNLTDKSTSDI